MAPFLQVDGMPTRARWIALPLLWSRKQAAVIRVLIRITSESKGAPLQRAFQYLVGQYGDEKAPNDYTPQSLGDPPGSRPATNGR
jgi:hypothetical protein